MVPALATWSISIVRKGLLQTGWRLDSEGAWAICHCAATGAGQSEGGWAGVHEGFQGNAVSYDLVEHSKETLACLKYYPPKL